MRVRAIKLGYHGILRVPGTKDAEFDVPDDCPLGSWMEKVEDAPSLFPHEGAAVSAGAQSTDELSSLRAKWNELTGKIAAGGWTIGTLKKKLAALAKTH